MLKTNTAFHKQATHSYLQFMKDTHVVIYLQLEEVLNL